MGYDISLTPLQQQNIDVGNGHYQITLSHKFSSKTVQISIGLQQNVAASSYKKTIFLFFRPCALLLKFFVDAFRIW